jgi:hypothetical protein
MSSTLFQVHGAGILHRDATANNILGVPAEDKCFTPEFTLVDFGLAVDRIKWEGGHFRTAPIGGDSREDKELLSILCFEHFCKTMLLKILKRY